MEQKSNNPGGHAQRPDAASKLSDTLRWAFELDQSPVLAGATWLTREIIPDAKDPYAAILAPTTSLDALRELKNAYKMLRTTGVTAAERSLAARLYAATIAAALVRHGTAISTQTPVALQRAFTELAEDADMPEELRMVASRALNSPPKA